MCGWDWRRWREKCDLWLCGKATGKDVFWAWPYDVYVFYVCVYKAICIYIRNSNRALSKIVRLTSASRRSWTSRFCKRSLRARANYTNQYFLHISLVFLNLPTGWLPSFYDLSQLEKSCARENREGPKKNK